MAPLIALGICAVSYVGLVVVCLVLPSRRGKLRTERSLLLTGMSLADAHAVCVDRLETEGFRLTRNEPTRLRAARAQKYTAGNPLVTAGHGDKSLAAELVLEQRGPDVHLTLALWLRDLVFYDTGEGQYIEAMLDRLLLADLRGEPPPVVPNTDFNASCALANGLGMVVASLWLLRTGMDAATARDFAVGVNMCWIYSAVFSVLAWRAIGLRPDEVKGTGQALAGIALATAACGLAWGLYLAIHRVG